jgi:hypothetical protein
MRTRLTARVHRVYPNNLGVALSDEGAVGSDGLAGSDPR